MPNIPNTNQPGLILFSTGDGQNSSQWGDSPGSTGNGIESYTYDSTTVLNASTPLALSSPTALNKLYTLAPTNNFQVNLTGVTNDGATMTTFSFTLINSAGFGVSGFSINGNALQSGGVTVLPNEAQTLTGGAYSVTFYYSYGYQFTGGSGVWVYAMTWISTGGGNFVVMLNQTGM